MTHEELYEKSGQQVVNAVVGVDSLTSNRHGGQFTENNPYYLQFANATNSEDRDALYAKAVEWQANYFNTLEEREYNSPTNRVARDKAAGINSDILAATGGGSGSSSSPGSAIQSPQTDVQYSSVGSKTSRLVDSIGAASNVLSSVASFGTATINAIEQVKTMPSRVSLADSQAYIAEQTKDAVVQSSESSAIQSRLSLINQLASYFTPESTTEDYSNVLSTLGIAADMIPNFEGAIRNYHTNPAYRADYEGAIYNANDAAARNAIRSSEVLNELYEKTLTIEKADKDLTILSQSLESAFNDYLVQNGYAEQTAENVMSSTNAQSDALELTRAHLKRDIQAFGENLNDVKESVHGIDARIQAIVGNAKNERRMISATEQFEIDTLNNLRNQLMTLGSSQLQSVYSIIDNANAIMYQNSELLNTDGDPIINVATPRFLRTINTTFGNMVSADSDIVSTLIQSVPFVGSLFTNTTPEQDVQFQLAPYKTRR